MFNYLAGPFIDLSSLRRSKYEVLIKRERDQMPGGACACRTYHKGLNQESLKKVEQCYGLKRIWGVGVAGGQRVPF